MFADDEHPGGVDGIRSAAIEPSAREALGFIPGDAAKFGHDVVTSNEAPQMQEFARAIAAARQAGQDSSP